MSKQEKLAAWLGLVGFFTGFVSFMVFVWPKLREEYLA